MSQKQTLNYGPLQSFLSSPDMTEVMVNSWKTVFVEHKGLLVQTASKFIDERAFLDLVYSILLADNKDYSKALSFDGVLPEGHRYNITLPPLSPHSPTLTIRKFSDRVFTLQDLVVKNFLTPRAADFLQSAIESRLNIIVSGGTGTGKTSFLNCLSQYIPEDQRVISIEDTQEMRPQHPHWIHLLTVKKEAHSFSARDCLANSLRMRPDRIIVGECRGAEAFDMLQAMNTGHEGSMTTLHASNAISCLSRLETLVSLANADIPLKYIRYQMSQALDLVVQLKRHSNGQRQVVEILELTGLQGDVITRSNIFELNKKGELAPTGYVPRCLSKMHEAGSGFKSQFFDPQFSYKKAG